MFCEAGRFSCGCGSDECFVEPALSPLLQWLVFLLPGRFPHRTVCARCLRHVSGVIVPNGDWHKPMTFPHPLEVHNGSALSGP